MATGSVMQALFGKIMGQPTPQQNPQATPAVPAGQPPANNNPQKNQFGLQTEQTPGTEGNGTVPQGSKESPLKNFDNLWQPTPVDPNAPKPVAGPSVEDILKAAGKIDFSKALNPEHLEALEKGGEGSGKALIALLNQAAQASYGQGAVTTSKLVADAVKAAREDVASTMPQTIKKQGARENLFKENPGFSNPAVAPIVDAVMAQIADKFPKASQSELESLAKNMLMGTADVLKPSQESKEADVGQPDPNGYWDAYLAGENEIFKPAPGR
jgi:hypothetical protein